jgi:hypothetical protein
MSEHTPEPAAEETAAGSQEFTEPVRTGVEEVDDVLDSVEGLEGTPVDDHVAVFEAAHDRLRRALDAGPDA